MSPRVPNTAPTFGQVAAESRPKLPGQPETLPWVFYDTQLYTSAATVLMTFFQVTNVDRTITNMVQAGAFPHPQYFTLYYMGLDFLADATLAGGNTEVGVLDDIAKLVLVSRATFELTISDKLYGPFPISFLHASGGPTGVAWGTLTAPESVQVGNNGVFDGGFCWNGAITIPPNTGFNVVLRFAAAQTLQSGNTNIRIWMLGSLSRKVT